MIGNRTQTTRILRFSRWATPVAARTAEYDVLPLECSTFGDKAWPPAPDAARPPTIATAAPVAIPLFTADIGERDRASPGGHRRPVTTLHNRFGDPD